MAVCARVPVQLRQAEVDHIGHVLVGAATHQEVVWFDVSVDVALCVNDLQTTQKLIGQDENGL